MNHNIAIIGASGFLGKNLSDLLISSDINHSNYDIDFSKDSVSFADVEDITSLDKLSNHNCIINLAAEHRDDVSPISRYDDVNIQGAKNICNVAKKYNINKIIFTSSVAVYGFAPSNTNESGDIEYFNDYGRTKFLAELVYKEWLDEDPINRTLVIIRPTVIFGEGNRGNVYNLLKQIADNRFLMFGNGKNVKSMAYVGNVSAFIQHSTDFSSGIHLYNYIDKDDLDMNSLVRISRKILFNKDNVGLRLPAFFGKLIGYFFDALAKILNRKLPISSIRVKKFLSNSQFDSAVKKTGFVAPFSIKEALIKTLKSEFLKNN